MVRRAHPTRSRHAGPRIVSGAGFDPASSGRGAWDLDALKHFDGERYHLHAWCVMPNHVHVLVTPLGRHTLSSIVHSWKSHTANRANKRLGRRGAVWMPEYFDRAVRDERHFIAAVEYIENNPVQAGLCEQATDWEWSSAGDRTQASSLGVRASSPQEKK